MNFLLGTNVISEADKLAGNANERAWLSSVNEADLYVSVLVLGEIRQGIERLRRRRDRTRADVLEEWVETLKDSFAERLLPVSLGVVERWGHLNATRPLPVVDGLLAATAIEHDLTLVTRERRTLAGCGARLLDPWRA